jgi:hypothetical protein
MLLQTNSYIVPKEKRAEHSRLIRRFRQTLLRLGCDHFEVYEQVGSNWSNSESAGRYVQILRFLDRKHQLAVQAAERSDPTAQAVIADFCDLINFPYQQQQGLFAVGFYTSVLPVAPKRGARGELVSTVEHEVIDDPEAEMPYPGASDGPPLETAVDENSEAISPEAQQESAEHEAVEPMEAEEQAAEVTAEVVEESPSVVPEEVLAEATHSEVAEIAEVSEVPETREHTHSEDDFMKLVGGDLNDDALNEDAGEESANGFIEAEFDEHTDAEPAQQHKSKDRPPGW